MKIIFKTFLICLLVAFALLLLFSCGARKSSVNQFKEETQIDTSTKNEESKESESNVKETEHVVIDDKNKTEITETIYEPIDPKSPAHIIDKDGKKTDLYNSKKTIRNIKQQNDTKADIAKTSAETHKSKIKTKSESDNKSLGKGQAKVKEVQRDSWSVWWLLIPAGALYYVWRNRVSIGKKIAGIWWV